VSERIRRARKWGSAAAAAGAAVLVAAACTSQSSGQATSTPSSSSSAGTSSKVTQIAIALPPGADPFGWLFSESAGRVVVAVPPAALDGFTELCAGAGITVTELGAVEAAAGALEVAGVFRVGLDELRAAHTATLPALFD